MKMALAAVVACGVFIVPAYCDDFGDFRIPKHRVYSVIGGLNGRIADGTDNGNRNNKSTESAGDLFGWGFWLYDSDPLRFALAGHANVADRLTKDYDTHFMYGSDFTKTKYRDVSEKWTLSADGRYFPWAIPLGCGLSGTAEGFYRQYWANSYEQSDYFFRDVFSYKDFETWNYHYSLQWAVTAGVGRVRDATPVYRVDIIESRLRSSGLIGERLRPETRKRLASVLYMQPEYNRIHDRPLKFVWEEIERILRSDGALTDSTLDAYDIYRITEPEFGSWKEFVSGYHNPLDASRDMFGLRNVTLRQTGFFFGLSWRRAYDFVLHRSEWRHRTVVAEVDSLPSISLWNMFDHHEESYRSGYTGPTAEYHRPLSTRWQLDGSAQVHFPLHKVEHGIDAETQLSATYLVADRWRVRTQFRHRRLIADEYFDYRVQRINEWISVLSANAAFFIEDNLQINLSVENSHSNYLDYSRNQVNPERKYSRLTLAKIGLAYHFMGGLDAPGIVAPSRLLPRRSL